MGADTLRLEPVARRDLPLGVLTEGPDDGSAFYVIRHADVVFRSNQSPSDVEVVFNVDDWFTEQEFRLLTGYRLVPGGDVRGRVSHASTPPEVTDFDHFLAALLRLPGSVVHKENCSMPDRPDIVTVLRVFSEQISPAAVDVVNTGSDPEEATFDYYFDKAGRLVQLGVDARTGYVRN